MYSIRHERDWLTYEEAAELHALNRFSVTRQLRYSTDETRNALDVAIFINGLPIATFELKNSLTTRANEGAGHEQDLDCMMRRV